MQNKALEQRILVLARRAGIEDARIGIIHFRRQKFEMRSERVQPLIGHGIISWHPPIRCTPCFMTLQRGDQSSKQR
jgi:hypothetical protein